MSVAENPFSRLLEILRQQTRKDAGPAWGWGEVISVSPLRVAYQGVQLTEAQLADANKWGSMLHAGDRVPVLPDREDGSFAIIRPADGGEGTFAPLEHTHGNVTSDGKVGTTPTLPIITGAGGALQAGAFGASAGQFCQGNDPRLSDARPPASHAHGNVANDGKIGSTPTLPIITGTGGLLQAGAFGASAGQFCQGNDPRLSDARPPASHVHGNVSNDGKVGSVANLFIATGTAGVIEAKTVEQIKAILKPILLEMEHPILSIWESEDSTSPATLFGGTWSTYGAGRVVVGLDSSDPDFDTPGETRGAKTHTLTEAEIPLHTHGQRMSGANYLYNHVDSSGSGAGGGNTGCGDLQTLRSDRARIYTASTGGSGAHNNIQPSIVLYRWKRTA